MYIYRILKIIDESLYHYKAKNLNNCKHYRICEDKKYCNNCVKIIFSSLAFLLLITSDLKLKCKEQQQKRKDELLLYAYAKLKQFTNTNK